MPWSTARRTKKPVQKDYVIVPIVRKEENGETYHIGTVFVPDADAFSNSLPDLWEEWMETSDDLPDSDSQFVDWLIQEKGYSAPFSQVQIAYLS